MKDLSTYAENKFFSQYGEDGIIEEILQRLSHHIDLDGYCSEFGAWDGVHLSNTCYLIRNMDYSAVLIEGDEDRVADLNRNFPQDNVQKIHRFVTFEGENSLDNIYKQCEIPKNFDFLSIDVDGVDYHIFESLRDHQPKIICVEFNPTIPNAVEFVQKKDMTLKQGNSARALTNLADRKGYALVAATHCNLIFVDSQLAHFVTETLPSLEELNPKGNDATYIFSGYDGTILSNKSHYVVHWHGVRVPIAKLQFLPKFLRRYYGDYDPVRGLLFVLLVALKVPNHLSGAFKRFKASILNGK